MTNSVMDGGRSIPWNIATIGTMTALTCSASAHADVPSLDIGSNEVYLDTETGQLSGRLKVGYEDANINQVVVIAPEESQVTLTYWRTADDSDCPGPSGARLSGSPIPRTAIVRSGAPTGAVVSRGNVREQKFVARIGPLMTDVRYCLAYEVTSKTKLSDDDKLALDAALNATVDQLATTLMDGADAGAQGELLQGSARRASEAQLCSDALGKVTITPEDFANLFNCRLGWPRSEWIVTHPVNKSALRIKDAVALYLQEDANFRAEVEAAWTARESAKAEREGLLDALDSANPNLLDLEENWPLSDPRDPKSPPLELQYDPVPGIRLDPFSATLLDQDLKKVFAALPANREAFTHALYENGIDLKTAGKRAIGTTAAEKAAEKVLDAFLKTKPEVRPLVVRKDEVESLRKGLRAQVDDPAKRAVDLATLARVPPPAELQAYPQFASSPNAVPLLQLSAILKRLRDSSNAMNAKVAEAKRNSSLEPDTTPEPDSATLRPGGPAWAKQRSWRQQLKGSRAARASVGGTRWISASAWSSLFASSAPRESS